MNTAICGISNPEEVPMQPGYDAILEHLWQPHDPAVKLRPTPAV